MAIREGRWDCPSCGSTAIYGRHVDCPGCGKPRPAGVRFYLTDDAPVVTDAAQLAEAQAGADWICQHCAASNRATLAECGGCGAPRGSSPSQRVIDYAAGAVPRSGDEDAPASSTPPRAGPDWICNHCDARCTAQMAVCHACGEARGSVPATPRPRIQPAAAPPAEPPAPPPTAPAAMPYVGTGLTMAFIGFFVLLAWAGVAGQRAKAVEDAERARYYAALDSAPLPPPRLVTVEGRRWERSVEVRERRWTSGAGYSVPGGARILAQEQQPSGTRRVRYRVATGEREVRRTVQVPDGYETRTREVSERVQTGTRTYVCGQTDLGNGYFADRTCTEDVYETRTRTETYREPTYRTESFLDTVTTYRTEVRTVPAYRTWYTWETPSAWVTRTVTATGDGTPTWPDLPPGPDRQVGERNTYYFLRLRSPGDAEGWDIAVDSFRWAQTRVGQRLAFRTGRFSNVYFLPTDSLPECVAWHAGQAAAPSDSLGCTPPPAANSTAAPDSAARPTP